MTVRQRRVYTALVEVCADGWPATVREIGKAAGLFSPGSVHETLIELEHLGLAWTNPRQTTRRGGWRPRPKGAA